MIIKRVKEIEQSTGKLTSAQKALLVTDGSSTALLEAFTGSKIAVLETKQETVLADKKIAYDLKVSIGEGLNMRRVSLVADGRVLVYAESYAPLSRLNGEWKYDIMHTNMPIGKILKNIKLNQEERSWTSGSLQWATKWK